MSLAGWNELNNGTIVKAVFTMYSDGASGWGDWFLPILFLVYQAVLYIKTRNTFLCFTTATMFVFMAGVAYSQKFYVSATSLWVLVLLLAIEFAGVVYTWIVARTA